jgi:membrane protease YdiL (CAAX protease family)
VQADAAEAAYHALFRIPNATAVSEELIFRTAVEATFAAGHSRLWAALASAKLFGLWHILPTIDRLLPNPGITEAREGKGPNSIAVVAASVVTTAIGGLALSWLRERTKSIATPIVVHAALNVGAFAGGWVAHQIDQRQDTPAMH